VFSDVLHRLDPPHIYATVSLTGSGESRGGASPLAAKMEKLP
jgi:hypothetical protein